MAMKFKQGKSGRPSEITAASVNVEPTRRPPIRILLSCDRSAGSVEVAMSAGDAIRLAGALQAAGEAPDRRRYMGVPSDDPLRVG